VSAAGRVRIGELSRRTGVSVDLLRVWERRYGLLRPERTPGRQRLYSSGDEERIRAMNAGLAGGLSAAEAARVVTAESRSAASPPPAASAGQDELARQLSTALEALDAVGAHTALDRLFAQFGVEPVLAEVVLPYLRDLGDRWACAEITVAQEHFASRLLNSRLLAVARGWEGGTGPRALLACPPGEEHDLGLISFGIALRGQGWRIAYLGANTPIVSILELVPGLGLSAAVLSATAPARFVDVAGDLRTLGRAVPLVLGGAGASDRLARDVGARLLEGDAVTAALELARATAA